MGRARLARLARRARQAQRAKENSGVGTSLLFSVEDGGFQGVLFSLSP
jgi:hypothetical protein